MGRRIEVELTSARDDGSWTWRAAGAKQPKGDVDAALLYQGAKVGDVVKVEAEFHLDGIEVTEVFAPKAKKERTDLLELKTRPLRDDELVTTQRVARGDRRGGRGERGDRGRSRGRDDDRGQRRGGGGGGGGGDRERHGGGERRGPRPEADRRPRPKRLRPRRVHRDAMLATVTEEHRPIVEQVIKDGMPGVRAAIEKQNAEAKDAGKPEIDATPILAIAEQNLGRARLAEWRDRADAALADAEELDIRDLRSVVVAGADVARDDESRAVAEQIKAVLDTRLESDHAAWLQDLDSAVTEGRVVRGLRLSSRPVKAGAPLPTEIASKLAQQASEALAADVMQDRWATVLDALAFSPVRGAVTPAGLPAEPSEELLGEVRRLSDRIPAIAALFGIDPSQVPKSAKRRRPARRDQKNKPGSGGGRPAEGRKPRAPSATKANARPVPGAEKPKPTEEKDQAPADRSTDEQSAPAEGERNGAVGSQTPQPEPAADSGTEGDVAADARIEAEPEATTEAAADDTQTLPEAEPEATTEAAADDAQPQPDPSPAAPSAAGADDVSADTGDSDSGAGDSDSGAGDSDSDTVSESDPDPVVGAKAGEPATAGD